MNFAIAILIIACVGVLVWNFVPAVRERLRGMTSIIEAVLAAALYYFGVFADAIKEGQAAGYIPPNWVQYVPFILLAAVILQRLKTKTPVKNPLEKK